MKYLQTIKKLHEENKRNDNYIRFTFNGGRCKTAERVIVMNDGHVEMQGTVAEVVRTSGAFAENRS